MLVEKYASGLISQRSKMLAGEYANSLICLRGNMLVGFTHYQGENLLIFQILIIFKFNYLNLSLIT